MESLQSLVIRRAREIGANNPPQSIRELERACHRKVSRTVFQRIMAGTYSAVPSQETLDGIAEAIGVDVSVVERAAGAPPSYGPFDLPNAARLTPSQREAVKHVVEVMLQPAVEERSVLRAVAGGRKGPVESAKLEARDKARKARSEHGD